MRYTRNRQMQKIDTSIWKGQKNYPIEVMKRKLKHNLDPTFEWDREVGIVIWSNRIGNIKSTKCALLKYPEHVR